MRSRLKTTTKGEVGVIPGLSPSGMAKSGEEQGIKRIVRFADRDKALTHVVKGLASGLETVSKGGVDRGQIVLSREAMVAGDAVAGLADGFVVAQIGKTPAFGAI